MNERNKAQGIGGADEITVWGLARLLLQKVHWLLLAGLLTGAVVYLAVSLLIAPTYESRVSFYVFNSAGNAGQSGTVNNGDLQAAESLATTYSKILASNSILDAVLEEMGPEEKLTRKELSQMINVSVVSNTQLLEVVVTSTDPEFACRIAGAFARVAPTEIVRITKAGGVEVVDRPEAATDKAAPHTAFDSAIGFVIGIILTAVIIVIRNLADTTIYLPDDITAAVDVTVLGQIPTIDYPTGGIISWQLAEGGAVFYDAEKQDANDE